MGTFERATIGEVWRSPSRVIDQVTVRALIETGGYTHPLFADPAFARASAFGRTPLPGEAVLLIMGGLAEQTERFDDTVVALLGLDEVRFERAVFEGDSVGLEIEILATEEPAEGRGILVMAWRGFVDGRVAVSATARMLFRVDPA